MLVLTACVSIAKFVAYRTSQRISGDHVHLQKGQVEHQNGTTEQRKETAWSAWSRLLLHQVKGWVLVWHLSVEHTTPQCIMGRRAVLAGTWRTNIMSQCCLMVAHQLHLRGAGSERLSLLEFAVLWGRQYWVDSWCPTGASTQAYYSVSEPRHWLNVNLTINVSSLSRLL